MPATLLQSKIASWTLHLLPPVHGLDISFSGGGEMGLLTTALASISNSNGSIIVVDNYNNNSSSDS